MPIPKSKTPPVMDVQRKKILLHAFPKFGKSTWAASIPDSIFLATEPGLGSIEAMRWEDERGNYVIGTWEELLRATKEVVESGRFHTVILDGVDGAWELCREYVCRQHNEQYHTDGKLGYGKGLTLINNEVRRYLTRLGMLNMGVILLAHTVNEMVNTRTGEIQRAVPNLPEKARRPLLGMMDMIFYGDFEMEHQGEERTVRRVLRTKPHPAWEAGDRTGRLPETIPLSFEALVAAFKRPA
jgi:hypothetical protein